MAIRQISVTEAAAGLSQDEICLLDIREPWELATASVRGALAIPMTDIPNRLEDLRSASAERNIVVMCHSGHRSRVVVQFLNQAGFDGVFNLDGGIAAWSQQIDANVPSY